MMKASAFEEAARLVERRLEQTTGFYGRPAEVLSERQRGIQRALEEVIALLRAMAIDELARR